MIELLKGLMKSEFRDKNFRFLEGVSLLSSKYSILIDLSKATSIKLKDFQRFVDKFKQLHSKFISKQLINSSNDNKVPAIKLFISLHMSSITSNCSFDLNDLRKLFEKSQIDNQIIESPELLQKVDDFIIGTLKNANKVSEANAKVQDSSHIKSASSPLLTAVTSFKIFFANFIQITLGHQLLILALTLALAERNYDEIFDIVNFVEIFNSLIEAKHKQIDKSTHLEYNNETDETTESLKYMKLIHNSTDMLQISPNTNLSDFTVVALGIYANHKLNDMSPSIFEIILKAKTISESRSSFFDTTFILDFPIDILPNVDNILRQFQKNFKTLIKIMFFKYEILASKSLIRIFLSLNYSAKVFNFSIIRGPKGDCSDSKCIASFCEAFKEFMVEKRRFKDNSIHICADLTNIVECKNLTDTEKPSYVIKSYFHSLYAGVRISEEMKICDIFGNDIPKMNLHQSTQMPQSMNLNTAVGELCKLVIDEGQKLPVKISKIIPMELPESSIKDCLKRHKQYSLMSHPSHSESKVSKSNQSFIRETNFTRAPTLINSFNLIIQLAASKKWNELSSSHKLAEKSKNLSKFYLLSLIRLLRRRQKGLKCYSFGQNAILVEFHNFSFKITACLNSTIQSQLPSTIWQSKMRLKLAVDDFLVNSSAGHQLAVRIFKYWISANFLSNFMGDLFLEFLSVAIFTNSSSLSLPSATILSNNNPYQLFLELLEVIHKFDFATQPLIFAKSKSSVENSDQKQFFDKLLKKSFNKHRSSEKSILIYFIDCNNLDESPICSKDLNIDCITWPILLRIKRLCASYLLNQQHVNLNQQKDTFFSLLKSNALKLAENYFDLRILLKKHYIQYPDYFCPEENINLESFQPDGSGNEFSSSDSNLAPDFDLQKALLKRLNSFFGASLLIWSSNVQNTVPQFFVLVNPNVYDKKNKEVWQRIEEQILQLGSGLVKKVERLIG